MSLKQKFVNKLTLFITILFIAAGLAPLIDVGVAHAALITSRSIELSDSSSTASNANTAYQVGFTSPSNYTVKGIVVDFCDNDPIVGDSTCTAPSGFSLSASTVTTSGAPNTGLTGTWTVTLANSNRTLELTNSTGTALNNTAIIFTINSVQNPTTTNHTFYARILTYTTTGGATGYAPGTEGAFTDYGGVAMSTANNITITAKVQEQITFCVYTTGGPCGTGSTVTLGDTHGVLSTSGPFVDVTTKYDIATNAQSGVAIRVKGDTLKSGSNSIAGIGATAAKSSAGTSQFGFCTYKSSGASGLTAVTLYDGTGTGAGGGSGDCSTTSQTAGTGSTGGNGSGATEAYFGFDTTNINSTYGQTFANKTAGASSTGTIAFIGNISSAQQAGIYTTTLIFIATGTY